MKNNVNPYDFMGHHEEMKREKRRQKIGNIRFWVLTGLGIAAFGFCVCKVIEYTLNQLL